MLHEPDALLIVTSRSEKRANALASELQSQGSRAEVTGFQLDLSNPNFAADLASLRPDIVVHTAGPYQNQDYRVPRACIQCGSHYIDLADAREFVCNFQSLNDEANSKGVLLITGASTLPGLSSAVIDFLRAHFGRVDEIRISIAPAHQTPRGAGTVAAVLSYCGKPFKVLEGGRWTRRFGWQNIKSSQHPELGFRFSAACDVPDLSLLAEYVPGVKAVSFHAALESKLEQLSLWFMSFLSRMRLVDDWAPLVPFVLWVSGKTLTFGSATGGMHMRLTGLDENDRQKSINWYLTAKQNHGPEIPCVAALILVRKMLRDEITERGAMACLGMITLAEFDAEVGDLDIAWYTDEQRFA